MQNSKKIFYFEFLFLFSLLISHSAYSQELSNNRTNANKDNENAETEFIVAGIKLSAIKGGTFIMGSNDSEARETETPHTVTVGDFAMMKYEVTVFEFKKFIDATGYKTDADKGTGGYGSLLRNMKTRDYKKGVNWKCGVSGEPRPQSEYNHPVIHISYNDATAYAEWLSRKTGYTWRLPTEAEWEYAARGGENFKFSGSDNINDVGWYSKNSGSGTNPVGQKSPNNYGLYDMTGNVWEMCSDWFNKSYYKNSPQNNPQGPPSGNGRVLRGGSWGHDPQFCRTAFRHHRRPDARNVYNGFRLVFIQQIISVRMSDPPGHFMIFYKLQKRGLTDAKRSQRDIKNPIQMDSFRVCSRD